jgi:putative transposase
VIGRQNRLLDAMYLIVYLDFIAIKVRQSNSMVNKAIFLALGITLEGHKALLGM